MHRENTLIFRQLNNNYSVCPPNWREYAAHDCRAGVLVSE